VNEERVVFLEAPRQFSEKVAQAVIGMPQPLVMPLKLLAGPADRPLSSDVEPLRIEQGTLVMVAQNHPLTSLPYQRQALAGVGPIADHITQAIKSIDFLLIDVLKHGRKGFEIAVDITDDRELHKSFPAIGSASNGWIGRSNGAAAVWRCPLTVSQ